MWKNKTNGGEVNLKICGILYVKNTYSDRHIRRHLGILAEILLKFSMSVVMLHNGLDTVLRLNLHEAVK